MRTTFSTKYLELIIAKIGLSDGDPIDVEEHDKGFTIKAVADTPKKYITQVDGVKKEFSTEEEYKAFLKESFPMLGLLRETHNPDGTPKRKFKTREEYLKFLDDTCGSIDDPTFVEPPEVD